MYVFSLGLLVITLLSVKKTDKNTDSSFDIISSNQTKGLAILFVILSHLNVFYFKWQFMKPFGTIGVTLFLFSSGYGLVKSYHKRGLENFGRKRLSTVYMPYLFITIVWLIVNHFTNQRYGLRINLLALAGLDYTRSIDATMWYIPFIFFWYGAFYVAFKFFRENIWRIILLFSFSIIAGMVWRRGLLGGASFQWALHSLTFPMGVLYALYGEKFVIKSRRKLLVPIFLVATFLYPIVLIFLSDGISQLFFTDMISVAVVVPFFIILKLSGIKVTFLERVGTYSYELYLVEGYLIDHILKTHLYGNKYALLVYVIATIFTAIVLKKVTIGLNSQIQDYKRSKISLKVEA